MVYIWGVILVNLKLIVSLSIGRHHALTIFLLTPMVWRQCSLTVVIMTLQLEWKEVIYRQLNTETRGAQRYPSVGMSDDGDFVISWHSYGDQDGDEVGIYAQRFDSMGNAQGSEFQVNTYTTSDQKRSSLAMDAGGDFVISWRSNDQDCDGYGVYGKRYNSSGVAQIVP